MRAKSQRRRSNGDSMYVVCLMLLFFMAPDPSAAQRRDGIRAVAWLQGAWERITPQQTVEEQWLAPRGNTMIGIGRTVKGDSLVEYEMIILRARGSVSYTHLRA